MPKCQWCPATADAEPGQRGMPAGWSRIDCRYRREENAEVSRAVLVEDPGPLLCIDCLAEAAASL